MYILAQRWENGVPKAPDFFFLAYRTGADPGGGGGSTDPKMVTRNNVLCRRRRFCFRHPVRGEVLFSPHVFIPKMLRFFRGIQKHTKRPPAFVGAPLHGDKTS